MRSFIVHSFSSAINPIQKWAQPLSRQQAQVSFVCSTASSHNHSRERDAKESQIRWPQAILNFSFSFYSLIAGRPIGGGGGDESLRAECLFGATH